jgi:acyl carrier protein
MNTILSDQDTKAVYGILTLQLGIAEDQITLEARIQEDLGADSLDVMEIIMSLEERFGVTIPDEVAERTSTVGELLEALADLRSRS